MIGQLQPVRVAPKGVDKTLPGQLRQVVLAAQVGQDQVLQVLPAQLIHQVRRLVVVQMSKLPADPLLEKGRVVATRKQVTAVVGLDHQCVEVPVTVQHLGAVRTQVSEQAKTPFTVTVSKRVLIPILRPVSGSPIGFNILISAKASGISEVYWKE